MEYQILSFGTSTKLERAVEGEISKGWEPLGGLSMTSNSYDGGNTYAQAMIRSVCVKPQNPAETHNETDKTAKT